MFFELWFFVLVVVLFLVVTLEITVNILKQSSLDSYQQRGLQHQQPTTLILWTPAGSLKVNSLLILPRLSGDLSQGELAVPQDCPPLQMSVVSPRPLLLLTDCESELPKTLS